MNKIIFRSVECRYTFADDKFSELFDDDGYRSWKLFWRNSDGFQDLSEIGMSLITMWRSDLE